MKYVEKLSITIFCIISITGILEHILIFQLSSQYNYRLFKALTLGLGYDLMNGAIFSLIILFTPLPLFYRKIISCILGFSFEDGATRAAMAFNQCLSIISSSFSRKQT